MTPLGLLQQLHQLDASVELCGDKLRIDAPKRVITRELRFALTRYKPQLLKLLRANTTGTASGGQGGTPRPASEFPRETAEQAFLESGTIAAVLIRSAVLDGALVWLVADESTLAEHPEIRRSGYVILYFGEVDFLRGKSAEELKAVAMTKRVFPKSRILQ